MTTNITPTLPPALLARLKKQATAVPDVCMGVMCPSHGRCQRYENVNGSDPEGVRIATCIKSGEFPLFMARAT